MFLPVEQTLPLHCIVSITSLQYLFPFTKLQLHITIKINHKNHAIHYTRCPQFASHDNMKANPERHSVSTASLPIGEIPLGSNPTPRGRTCNLSLSVGGSNCVLAKYSQIMAADLKTVRGRIAGHRQLYVTGTHDKSKDLNGPWGFKEAQVFRFHEGGKVVIPTHVPPLPPGKYSWYAFLQAESTLGP